MTGRAIAFSPGKRFSYIQTMLMLQDKTGPPKPEVIAKWDHLTHTGPLNITAAEMTELGHPLDAVQYPPEMGGISFLLEPSCCQFFCHSPPQTSFPNLKMTDTNPSKKK
jgi:hypothetical protein